MKYILTEADVLISFNDKDKIDIIPFGNSVLAEWSTEDGYSKEDLLKEIQDLPLSGSTALYPAAEKAIKILENEDSSKYVSSVILMTDGMANVGSFASLQSTYKKVGKEIPIYSITFGSADEYQLKQISDLSNGKVFDGKTSLVEAFKKVRGYN
jgi:Ca-activated chloride channel family protein